MFHGLSGLGSWIKKSGSRMPDLNIGFAKYPSSSIYKGRSRDKSTFSRPNGETYQKSPSKINCLDRCVVLVQ